MLLVAAGGRGRDGGECVEEWGGSRRWGMILHHQPARQQSTRQMVRGSGACGQKDIGRWHPPGQTTPPGETGSDP